MTNSTNPKISLDKSWKFTPQVLILIILGIIVILGILFLVWPKKETPQPEVSLPAAPGSIKEILKPGEIGEMTEAEKSGLPPETTELPPVIFNTSGKITQIQEDRLIVAGSGSNFVDKKPRTLTIIFTDSTTVFEPSQKTKYQGIEGLKYLKVGMEILIGGEENVRGKTQLIARTINIL